jgi:hypothetical protein
MSFSVFVNSNGGGILHSGDGPWSWPCKGSSSRAPSLITVENGASIAICGDGDGTSMNQGGFINGGASSDGWYC